MKSSIGIALSGLVAGGVNGLFGAGGGMVLVPGLRLLGKLPEEELFPSGLCVMVPLSLVSLGVYALNGQLPFLEALPYCLGGAVGGFAAGKWGQKIPTQWLHRGLGLLILWAGVRYLW